MQVCTAPVTERHQLVVAVSTFKRKPRTLLRVERCRHLMRDTRHHRTGDSHPFATQLAQY